MDISPGQLLAHYRLVDKLGEGGMGEVYLAEDTRLGRKVALKILPRALAEDDDRRARFEREARAVATLSHPNIVTIHGVEHDQGVHFFAMELVEGRTLTQVIPPDGLELDSLFELALPLVDAVAAAHEKGITHRDLKPDNVMVDAAGRVKVLDFGLAKLREAAAEDDVSDTQMKTVTGTRAGMILGTTSYMSPEQAEGREADSRSDVFSLGVILYQMATGRRPFEGDSPISILSSILRDHPPPLTALRGSLPRGLERVVQRALQKSPRRRFRTAADLHYELELLRDEVASRGGREAEASAAGSAPAGGAVAAPAARPGTVWTGLLAVSALAAGALAGWLLRPAPAPAAPGIGPVTFSQLTYAAGPEDWPSVSPDGEFLVYSARRAGAADIFLQRVRGARPINLTADIPEDCTMPAYSPDGRFIAFRSESQGGGLFVMGSTGESRRRLSDIGHDPAWSPDSREIVFATEGINNPQARIGRSALWVVDVASGKAREIFGGDAVQPSWSPGGERIAFWTYHPEEADSGQRDLQTIRADGTDLRDVTRDLAVDWNPVWGPDGRQLYFASDRDGSMNLWRMAIDPQTGETRGEAQRLGAPSIWTGPFDISADGKSLVYASRSEQSHIQRAPLDPETFSLTGPLRPVTAGSLVAVSPDVSPDGSWVAFRSSGRQEDVYVVRADGSDLRQLTDDIYKDRGPSFFPDGQRLAFYSNRSGKYEIWSIGLDGSGLQQMTETQGVDLYWPYISPDGRRLVARGPSGGGIFELGALPMSQDGMQEFPPVDGGIFSSSSWSPDGRRLSGSLLGPDASGWMIYDTDSSSYTSVKSRFEPTTSPVWAPDGRRLIFLAADAAAAEGGEEGNEAGFRLVVLDTATGEESVRPGKLPASDVDRLSLSADGRWLYLDRRDLEADIWLARLSNP